MALIEVPQQHLQQQSHVCASGGITRSDHQHTPVTGCVSLDSTGLTAPSPVIPILLDLFSVKLDERFHLPFGSQKVLDLKTGGNKLNYEATMSRNGKNPKIDLRLNLSPPRTSHQVPTDSPHRSATASPTSPPSSCVSSELNNEETVRYSNSPETTSMVLAGCPGCLMYVMLSEDEPKCPRCKKTVLLDFLQDNNNNNNTKRNSRKN
ncbi:hypothetical protein GIB67_012703 [Kingdonia uniflora]|uniref:GIR1-like zinc ribbon domain-containing protein n=1 Tax=Kingdonia uniflora TaxID=39325 RepID=A0A7J7NF39_9MAGN|nr:hypothetical protein GIB67_012703 [Kingdonia uniflora]